LPPPQAAAPPPSAPVVVAPPATSAIEPTAPLLAQGPSSKSPRPVHPVHANAVATEGAGFLTFDTYPWTKVTEGSALLGTTPLVHVSLAAGTHTLTLDNPERGIHQTYAVTIKTGEATTKRLGLE
jgi:hypothetical protein